MSETEYEVLDELYFVQHYAHLKEELRWTDEKILNTLQSLHGRELIKCLRTPDEEVFGDLDFGKEGKMLYYLATKKGLMAHNTI